MSFSRDIETAYGINVLKIRKYKDVYRIRTRSHGHLCLKPYKVDENEVQFIGQVHQHLIDAGFAFSPKVLFTLEGQVFARVENTLYMVTNWVKGSSPSYPSDLKNSVETLARFHRVSKYLLVPDVPERRFRVLGLEKRFKHTYNTLKDKYTGPLAFEFLELCEAAIQEGTTAWVQKALEHEFKCKAFVHGDYNYPNIVVDSKGRHHLIDFDNTAYDARMEDLAHIIHRNHPWNADGTLRMIHWYDHVRPIRNSDLQLLRALLFEPYPILRAISRRKLGTLEFKSIIPSSKALRSYSKRLRQLV